MNRRMQPAAIILVIFMFAAAGRLQENAAIFPEIAALACGAWVMEKPPWHFTALNVWLSPTLAAITGVIILRWLPASQVVMVCVAFMLVALQLKAVGSSVVPSLSAAILPILTNVDSFLYPLSVGVLTAAIALIHVMKGHRSSICLLDTASELHPLTSGKNTRSPGEGEPESGQVPLQELALWIKLSLGIAVVALLAQRTHTLFMIAPPLIVTFVELSKPKSPLRRKVPQIVWLLTLCAIVGVGSLHLIHYLLHWPLWISAGVTFSVVFVLYEILALPFPPAAAIALLPTIIPTASLWQYPWHVLIGSTTFLLISLLCFRNEEAVAAEEPGL